MSEFQYYEFVAIDRPLTAAAMRALRAITSRATITSTRLVNTYEWGDFKGDPRVLMAQYFDAFLYYANWGTHTLMLRLPRRVLDPGTVAPYCVRGRTTSSAATYATRTHTILELHSEDESGEWDGEPEGWLGSLIPVRSLLASGDRRALYLAWLLRVQAGEVRANTPEPPVPDGLRALDAALAALAEFLRIDPALVAVAAERSSEPPTSPSAHVLQRWLRAQSAEEKDAMLARLLAGNDDALRREQWHVIRRTVGARATPRRGGRDLPPRTAGELRAAAARRTPDGRDVGLA